MSRERLYLFDTTLRDGAQTNGVDFTLAVDLQIENLDRALAELIAEGLRQMVPVERVLLAELGVAVAARNVS